MKSLKVFIVANGCDRRLLDSQKITDFFKLNQVHITKNPNEADYIFVNTCAMSQTTEDVSINLIKKYGKHPAQLIVHGCLPQISPLRFHKEFQEKKIIQISTNELDEKIDSLFPPKKISFLEVPKPTKLYCDQGLISKVFTKFSFSELFYLSFLSALKFKIKNLNEPIHPRVKKGAYLQVSSGCNEACSYCAIPRAIGKVKSRPIDHIIEDYKNILMSGQKTVILTADNLGLYGIDNNVDLMTLFEKMNVEDLATRNTKWIINELSPKWLLENKSAFFQFLKKGKIKEICLPIQSGNQRIINLMNRAYDLLDVQGSILEMQKENFNVRLTTDIIVGFPTETDDEFLDTIRFIVQMRFDRVMFFSYGQREGTKAALLEFNKKENEKAIVRKMKMAMKILDKEKINYTFQ